MAFVNEEQNQRVIDYERNAYITASTEHYPGQHYVRGGAWDLHWNDEVIRFVAFYSQEHMPDETWEIKWTVFQCEIPQHLRTPENKKIIKGLISDALDTYGIQYGKTNVAKQHFAVDPFLKAFE